ncbi:MAG: DUF5010 C-terminal domain-containing protein [Prevotellaceae bacterium]|jgi:hypothetical protein|nr:DUF5010 C-terminal domain-containing protein [Prevotellaceae bacterium]
MKNTMFLFLSMLMLATYGCKQGEVNSPKGSVTLNYTEYSISVDESFQLKATVSDGTEGTLQYISSDDAIATVFLDRVTGRSIGICNVIAKVGKDSAVCRVTVTAPPVVAEQPKSVKRGVGFSFSNPSDVPVLGQGVSWFYTWGNSISSNLEAVIAENDVMFVPMFWNGVDAGGSDRVRAYKQRHPELEYILGFNEPNLTDQANMTPAQCAPKWRQLMTLADELDMKLVSPAMNYGTLSGYSDPERWLDEFFQLVPLSSVDAIAIHCYMPSSGSVIGYINKFRKYNKPIWLTEFCAWDGFNGGVSGQMVYMSEILNFLEAEPMMERYAWFIPRGNEGDNVKPWNKLLKFSGSELLPLGKVYIGASSQDKTIWANAGEKIEAEHFTKCSVNEYVDNGRTGEINNFHYLPTTDVNGNLEISDFLPNRWIEYQINVAEAGNYDLAVRYANFNDSGVEITIDGANPVDYLLQKTGDFNIWKTEKITLNNLASGHLTLRLRLKSGRLHINWLQFTKK